MVLTQEKRNGFGYSSQELTLLLDEMSVENLSKLWNRKKGEFFYLEKGRLKTMGVGQKIFYKCFCPYRKEREKKLRKTLDALIVSLEENCIAGEKREEFVSELFFKKLAPLSRKIYSRRLNPYLYQSLSQNKEIAQEEGEIGKEQTPSYQKSYLAAKFWFRLGSFEKLQGGSSCSYKILRGKIVHRAAVIKKSKCLGLFKPSNGDTFARNNPLLARKIKYALFKTILYPFRGSAFMRNGGQAFVAEAVSKIVENYIKQAAQTFIDKQPEGKRKKRLRRLLAQKLIPDTAIGRFAHERIPRQIGSYQMWVQKTAEQNYASASIWMGLRSDYKKRLFGKRPSDKEIKSKCPGELFDLMAILDYIIGNVDRHGENWFIVYDRQNKATGVRLIDGGSAMSPKHPTRWARTDLAKQYLWRRLSLAKEPFSDLGQFIIESLASPTLLNGLMKEIEELYTFYREEIPGESAQITKARLNRMKERIAVLYKLKTAPKKRLGCVRTAREIQRELALSSF